MTFDGALSVHMQDDHDVFSSALEAEAKPCGHSSGLYGDWVANQFVEGPNRPSDPWPAPSNPNWRRPRGRGETEARPSRY
jgi:hypothetical protein